MTFLIEEQICVYHFAVVWGFSWGWGWSVVTVCKFCTKFKKNYRNFYIPALCYLLKKYAIAENK